MDSRKRPVIRSAARLAAALLLAGCAGQPPASEPAPSGGVRSVAGISLRPDWRARIVVERADSIVITLPSGDHQLQRFDRHAAFSLTTDRNGTVAIRLDTLTVRPRNAKDTGGAPGASWAGQPASTSVNAMRVTGGGSAAAELTAVVRSLLPRLPTGGVRARMSWSDSATGDVRVDIFTANERRTAAWSAGAITSREGNEVLTVRVREDFEQIGDGNQGGRRMTMTSQGRRSGTYYVTLDGRVSSAQLDDSVAMLISIPTIRQVVPTIRYARTSVRFLSPGPGESD